ncbi:MAG: hypothetical protein KKA31_00700 [Candidatus Margulisbacteria bacterium]|nr:hypothetical protein [Candidatus Margulisiibacteriota bacterium]
MGLESTVTNQNIVRPAGKSIGSTSSQVISASIPLSSKDIPGYKTRIERLKQDTRSPFAPATRRPLPEQNESPIAAAQPPSVEVKEIKIHPSPLLQAEKLKPAVEQPGSNGAVLATLAKGIGDKELAIGMLRYVREQKALQGVGK